MKVIHSYSIIIMEHHSSIAMCTCKVVSIRTYEDRFSEIYRERFHEPSESVYQIQR